MFFMKYEYLIVGGTGYLGKNLLRSIDSKSILIVGSKSKKSDFNINFSTKNSFKHIKGYEFEKVIVLAADVYNDDDKKISSQSFKTNTYSFGIFLEYLCYNNKISKMLYFSSMSVYDNSLSSASELSKLNPSNTYGLSKMIAENLVNFLAKKKNISSLILRIPGVYGNERQSGLIYNSILMATFNKEINVNIKNKLIWEFIEINDLIKIIIEILNSFKWSTNVEVLNVGYGEPINILSTVQKIKYFLGSKSRLNINVNNKDFFMQTDKLRSVIDFKFSLENSLMRYTMNKSDELRNR